MSSYQQAGVGNSVESESGTEAVAASLISCLKVLEAVTKSVIQLLLQLQCHRKCTLKEKSHF